MPIALADLAQLIMCKIRQDAAKPNSVKVPRRDEWLESWYLPFLAEAVRHDEADQRARDEFAAFENLAKSLKGKQTK